ncbi:MAG: branched-chain amino acid ABC transporter permease [Clostridiales bacterium]|nr:branched-chain amino acid ABC transporter permease [Clostridiales bacterium]
MLLFAQLVNGLQLGSIYALIALGYSMVYGIIKLLNFAHGDVIMVGGYISLMIIATGTHPMVAVVMAVVGCALLAVMIYRLAYVPQGPTAPRLSLLIAAIGVSMLLQNLAQLIFSANIHSFPANDIIPMVIYSVGGVNISLASIMTIVSAVSSMAGLTLLVHKTKTGQAMLAVSEDTGAAQLMGVNVRSIVTFTFAIGAGLAGIGSILYCVRFPIVSPMMGALPGLKAFVAAVLGGIGSIPGAMIGGFAIGLFEALVNSAGLSTWTDGIVFAILIVVLLVRPTGFMGPSMAEKV